MLNLLVRTKLLIKRIIPAQYHETVGKIIKNFKIFSRKIIYFILVIDTDTFIHSENLSTLKAFVSTKRYKLAGAGISITKNEKRLVGLHNLHYGQRVFILGNGPSLNQCDLSHLKNEFTFGVNNIFLNYGKMRFHPTYYIVEDILVAEDRADQINNYHGPEIKFFGNYLHYCIEDAPDVVWLNVRVNYKNYIGFPYFSKNSARMVWAGGTVSYICMQLAFYMGFKDVYLLGFDHSYKIPSDAIVNGQKKEITSESGDPNHFDPTYFGKGFRWHDPQLERMESAYRRARECFEAEGRRILNASIGGQLEIFQRVNYRELFSKDHLLV
jgi:hypothetical protein